MFKNVKRLGMITAALALLASLGLYERQAIGQAIGFVLTNPIIQGHYSNALTGAPPTMTGCTILNGSTDTDWSCTATAASGTVTFGTSYLTAPICTVTDASATSTVSMPVYSVSASAITLSTIISTHVLYGHCAGKIGG